MALCLQDQPKERQRLVMRNQFLQNVFAPALIPGPYCLRGRVRTADRRNWGEFLVRL